MPFAAILLSRTAFEVYGLLILALVVHGLKDSYDARHEAIGAARVQALWDADKQARNRAFAAMTTKWITAATDAEKAIKERDDARSVKFAPARQKAASLPESLAAMPVPFESVVVLNDAIRDSAAATGAAAKPDQAAAGSAAGSNVGLVTQWGVECIAAYDMARERDANWQSFYQTLRDRQGKPEVTP